MTFDVEKIRAQFPSLHNKTENGTTPIYFDNPAGTQVPQSVMDAVVEYYTHMNANSGGFFPTSQKTDAITRAARERMADFVNAPSSDEIVFGPNMTTLVFALSRAIGKTLSPTDEIVLTRMDHDANVTPWTRMAEDYNLTVRWVDVNTNNCTLDMNSLEAVLNENTRIVATVHASNAVGTVNQVSQIAAMADAVHAYYIIDAVQSAPHVPIDVQAIGCDFLVCSAYKFFGPHIGILWGKYDLLEQLPAYKVRPSKNKTPYRWETGTPSYETIHAVSAAIDYFEAIGKEYGTGDLPQYEGRRKHLKQAMAVLQEYERSLVSRLIDILQSIDGVTIAGITDPARYENRVPTVAFTIEGYTSDEIAQHLAKNDIYVWSGDYYAVEIMNVLGHAEDGMVRVGLAHYNTMAEVERFGEVLRQLDD